MLHRRPVDFDDPQVRPIKAALRKFYHPDTASWNEMVLFRSRQVIGQALSGLSSRTDAPASSHDRQLEFCR